jgi:hypothetical protein
MKSKQHSQNRRDFLIRGAFTVGAAASLAIVARADGNPVDRAPIAKTSANTKSENGYRLTPHIKEYYAKARF